MPELPEVETVMRGLAPALLEQRIERAEAYRADLRWPLPDRFAERLQGRRVIGLTRRSKYILAALDDGWSWLIHLGMTGRFSVGARGVAAAALGRFVHRTGGEAATSDGADAPERGTHDHLLLETAGHRLLYNDVRRFGAMDLCPTAALPTHRLLAAIGPEPLSDAFGAAHLAAAFAGKTTSVKAALLDQRIVAGLGNIYVCEALWRSEISPKRAAGGLSRRRLEALAAAIRAVLEEAIEAGGSSLRDYRQADGAMGYFQHAFAVYGRAERPCLRAGCGGEVSRIVQGGRSSFYCPKCQR
ncbi:MAG: bifunctional DNA-formamidopyrimidine glycosylase/DNA-(apurinic or apyrimidinic site) lyase [Pseudomonadota bacterium]